MAIFKEDECNIIGLDYLFSPLYHNIEQLHNAYPGRRIREIDTSEPSGDIIFVFPCVFLMALFLKYLRNFFLSGLDPTTYITKIVFSRGMYWYQIC